MLRKSRNLILLLAAVLGLGGRAWAADAMLVIAGAETQPSGVWDSGQIAISFTAYNGPGDRTGILYGETVTYGQFSTPASIASAFGAMFTNGSFQSSLPSKAELCAIAVGPAIYFHLKGQYGFGMLSVSAVSTRGSEFRALGRCACRFSAPLLYLETCGSSPLGSSVA